jgi:hypothetical protein
MLERPIEDSYYRDFMAVKWNEKHQMMLCKECSDLTDDTFQVKYELKHTKTGTIIKLDGDKIQVLRMANWSEISCTTVKSEYPFSAFKNCTIELKEIQKMMDKHKFKAIKRGIYLRLELDENEEVGK